MEEIRLSLIEVLQEIFFYGLQKERKISKMVCVQTAAKSDTS
jgi:hypothetical protein